MAHSSRRTRRVLVVVLAVLVALGVVDAGARHVVEGRAADRLRERLPDVDVRGVHIGGWPFVAGAVGLVDVPVEADVRVGADALADLAPDSAQDATWRVTDGALVVETTLQRPRRTVPVEVALDVTADAGAVLVTPVAVSVAGMTLGPDLVSSMLGDRAAGLLEPRRLDPARLAGGSVDVRVEDVHVVDDGLALRLALQRP